MNTSAIDADGLRRRRQRARNWALLSVLLALVALIYIVAIVRMGGG
jgi:hypothetical protein